MSFCPTVANAAAASDCSAGYLGLVYREARRNGVLPKYQDTMPPCLWTPLIFSGHVSINPNCTAWHAAHKVHVCCRARIFRSVHQKWSKWGSISCRGVTTLIQHSPGHAVQCHFTRMVGDDDARAERPSAFSVLEGLAACGLLFLLSDVMG